MEGAVLAVGCPACKAVTRVEAKAAPKNEGAALGSTVQHTPPRPRPAVALGSEATETPSLSTVKAATGGTEIALSTHASEATAKANEAALGDPFAVPAGFCPKCISTISPGAPACAQCGLTFDRFEPDSIALSEWLTTTWRSLLSRWGDENAHGEVMHEAERRNELAQVGRLYRLRLASVPLDPFALRGRDEVLRLAVMPQLVAQSVPRDVSKTPPWQYALAAMMLIAALLAVFSTAKLLFGGSTLTFNNPPSASPVIPVPQPAKTSP